ncbi:MAG: response regulator [Gammaproteobacteria bacterium]|nr:response regulator [Gammaproteobacteria bacterium]
MKYILVADDEPLNQTIFQEMLDGVYECKTVDDGQACLESVESRTPDLILLDVAMPRVDGTAVCRKLKNDEQTRHIPIILVSAYASENDKKSGLAAGADDYVTKPFDIDDLQQRIEQLLDKP